MKKISLLFTVILIFVLNIANAQYDTLVNFNGVNTPEGNQPLGALTLIGDKLYGETQQGGTSSFGNLFSVYIDGSGFTDLYDFMGTIDGLDPDGTLALVGKKLYSTAQSGGAHSDGTIFSIDTDGSNFSVIYNMHADIYPTYGPLASYKNKLYGTTQQGGTSNNGVVYSFDTATTTYKALLKFTGTSGSHLGSQANGQVILSGSKLYGMTMDGGTNNDGAVYTVDTNGKNYKELFDCSSAINSGRNPSGGLVLAGKVLYGMMANGGQYGDGVLFSVDTDGNNYNDLVNFWGSISPYGANPNGSLILSGNTLYGTTTAGGASNDGVIFSVDTNGNNYTDIYDFSNSGANPYGSLTLSNGVLYGMTNVGGFHGDGVVFADNICGLLNATASNTAITCNGVPNGVASVASTTGGPTPYSYAWSDANSQTTASATGLSAGTYTVTVTDFNGCNTTASTIITQPNALGTSANAVTNVTCNGGTTGSASASPSGGTTPYTYQWSINAGLQTTPTATGLSAGTYTIVVGDACASGASAPVIITQPNALDASANASFNVNCNGGSNGSALSNASGGTSPYTYAWSSNSGSQTTALASVLTAGTYTITISDACSSSATATATITQPSLALSTTTYAGTSIAAVTPSGGTTPYTYNWTPVSGTTDTIKGLSLGTYSVTVTDANGCTKTASVDVTSATGIKAITSNSGTITIYPNPNNGVFNLIMNNEQGMMNVEVYNILGEKVYSNSIFNMQGTIFNIDLSSQADGVYLYRVLNSTGSLLGEGKIVIQK